MLVALAVAPLALTSCVADPSPIVVGAVAGNHTATVTWLPPLTEPNGLEAYVVTPFINNVPQTQTRFDSSVTTGTVMHLSNGTAYTFTVTGINDAGMRRRHPTSQTRLLLLTPAAPHTQDPSTVPPMTPAVSPSTGVPIVD